MANKFELMIGSIILGGVPAILGLLAGWWLSIPFVPESQVWLWAAAGLLTGVLIDVRFLKGWLKSIHYIPIPIWIAIYLFYSIGCFGFFMGVPVFNVALAVPAGFLMGTRLARSRVQHARVPAAARRTAWFTSVVLVVICITSAWLALSDPHTAANLEGMLGLTFTLTPAMIVALIVTGGATILALNWWLTKWAVEWACQVTQHASPPSEPQ